MINLSDKQREIVDKVEGPILVEAGPGSGKTRVIIERIKNLLLIKKRTKVLALTFSNLAADEMKNRIEEDKTVDELLDNVTICTVHSFCLELVQSRRNLLGKQEDMILFESENDRESLLKNIFIYNLNMKKILEDNMNNKNFIKECLSAISNEKRNFIQPEDSDLDYPFSLIYESYNEELIKQNILDFDDILYYAYKIVTENPKVKSLYNSLYNYVCVDEAQDLNFAQYQFLKALCGDDFKNIMLVGDSNQSIYGFNGSDSKYMTQNFLEDFNPNVYNLVDNYRSARAIVKYANNLENCDNTTNYVVDGELNIKSFGTEEEEADYIVQEIKKLLQYGHRDIEDNLSYEDIAIIARNKYVFQKIEKNLLENKIPYYIKSSSTGIEFESEYIKLFSYYIRLLINPKNLVPRNKIKKIIKSSFRENLNLIDIHIEINNSLNSTKYKKLIPILKLVDQEKERFNFEKILKKLEESIDEFCDDEKYLIQNDIEQWRKHWLNFCKKVPGENRSLISFQNSISLGKTQIIDNQGGITLLTAHMSKGLQYEVVFIVGLNEGTFPDYRAVKENNSNALNQEKNNMYVAVTRAKRLCYLSYPKIKLMPWGDYSIQKPSRYIYNDK